MTQLKISKAELFKGYETKKMFFVIFQKSLIVHKKNLQFFRYIIGVHAHNNVIGT